MGGGVMSQKRIPPAVWRYIEYELYSYDQTKKDLELLREEILHGTPPPEEGHSSGPGNPTESKGMRLISSPVIVRLERIVSAIERTIGQLTEDHSQLFTLKYIQGKHWRIVCQEMPTSERTYFRLRRDIVELVAEKIGLAQIWQE